MKQEIPQAENSEDRSTTMKSNFNSNLTKIN